MSVTTNFKKHTTTNPIQRMLLDRFNQRLLTCVRKTSAKTILDAGCGEGFTMKLLVDSGIQADIKGIDFSDEALSLAKQTAPDLQIVKASIYDLPFASKSFDLVICSEVLEHLDDPEKAVHEILRVSKKYVLISVPHEPYFQLANFLRGKYLKSLGNHPEHINHWSARGIVALLCKSGLSVCHVYTPFAWTLVLASRG